MQSSFDLTDKTHSVIQKVVGKINYRFFISMLCMCSKTSWEDERNQVQCRSLVHKRSCANLHKSESFQIPSDFFRSPFQ